MSIAGELVRGLEADAAARRNDYRAFVRRVAASGGRPSKEDSATLRGFISEGLVTADEIASHIEALRRGDTKAAELEKATAALAEARRLRAQAGDLAKLEADIKAKLTDYRRKRTVIEFFSSKVAEAETHLANVNLSHERLVDANRLVLGSE